MSEYPSTPQPEEISSPSGGLKPWFWVGLIGGVICLMVATILASIAGLGWMVYTEIQDDNATTTAQAVNESATATAIAQIVLPPPGWKLTIDDQFTSNQNGWEVGSIEGTYSHIVLSVKNDLYQWQTEANPEGMVRWVVPSPTQYRRMDDFYLSADCRQVIDGVSDFHCGLLLHFTDNDNVYQFVVAKNQTMRFMAEKKDNDINVLPWTYTPLIRPGEMNRLAVLAEGTHYIFFINGQYAYEVDDDQLAGGTVGLVAALSGVNDAEFQFDNFQVYEPAE